MRLSFLKKSSFKITLRLSEPFQQIGVCFCYNKWMSSWRKIRLANKCLNVVLSSTHPAGSRDHPKYRIEILHSLPESLRHSHPWRHWNCSIEKEIISLLPCSWMLILHDFNLICTYSGWWLYFIEHPCSFICNGLQPLDFNWFSLW